jgi:hypothetical protein
MKSGPPEPTWHVASDKTKGAEATPSSRSGHSIEAELDALKQRLAGAESALQTTRRVGSAGIGMMMVGTAVAVVLATTRSGAERSERTTLRAPFRVVDARGKLLLHLDADQNGTQLSLFDGAGKPVTLLGATPEGGIFRISSRGDRGNLQLYSDAHGGQIALSGQNKARPEVWLGAKEEGGGLGVYDEAGSPVAWITTSKDRRGLSVGDHAGRPVAWLGAAREGGVALYNRSGKTAAYLTISQGSGSLAVYDPAHKKAATLTADTDLSDHPVPGPAMAAGGPALPAAGGKLTQLATSPRMSTDTGWLLHRNAVPAAPEHRHPAAHQALVAPPLPGAARSPQVALAPQASSPSVKPATSRAVIGPESETGPQGAAGVKPTPAEAGSGQAPVGKTPPAQGESSASTAQPLPNRFLHGTRPGPGTAAGSFALNQKPLLTARPSTSLDRPHATQTSRPNPSWQFHPAGRATTARRSVRRHRHGHRHHTRGAHRYHRRHRRWLSHSHHRRHHAHRGSRRLARRPLHSRRGKTSHRRAERSGALLRPRHAESAATGGARFSAAAREPKHSSAVTPPTDPD